MEVILASRVMDEEELRGQDDLLDGDLSKSSALIDEMPCNSMGHREPPSMEDDEIANTNEVSEPILSNSYAEANDDHVELKEENLETSSEEIISSQSIDEGSSPSILQLSDQISLEEQGFQAEPTLSITPEESVADLGSNSVQKLAVEGGDIGSIQILQELYQRKCKECEGLRKRISFLNEAVKEAEDLVYQKSCEIEQMELRLQGVTYLHEEKRDEESSYRDKTKLKKKKQKKKESPARRQTTVRPKAPPTPEGDRKRNDPRIKKKTKAKEVENSAIKDTENQKSKTGEQRKRSKSFENRKNNKENEIRNKKSAKSSDGSSAQTPKKSQKEDTSTCIEKSERTKRKEALIAAVSARDGNTPISHEGNEIGESSAQSSRQNESLTSLVTVSDGEINFEGKTIIVVSVGESESATWPSEVPVISASMTSPTVPLSENDDDEGAETGTDDPPDVSLPSHSSIQLIERDLDDETTLFQTFDHTEIKEPVSKATDYIAEGNYRPDIISSQQQLAICASDQSDLSFDEEPGSALNEDCTLNESSGFSPLAVASVESLAITNSSDTSEEAKSAIHDIESCSLLSARQFENEASASMPCSPIQEAKVLDFSDRELLFVHKTQEVETDLKTSVGTEVLGSSGESQTTFQSPDQVTLDVKPESPASSADLTPKFLSIPMMPAAQDSSFDPSQTPPEEAKALAARRDNRCAHLVTIHVRTFC